MNFSCLQKMPYECIFSKNDSAMAIVFLNYSFVFVNGAGPNAPESFIELKKPVIIQMARDYRISTTYTSAT